MNSQFKWLQNRLRECRLCIDGILRADFISIAKKLVEISIERHCLIDDIDQDDAKTRDLSSC